jgi:hypothetical protein
MNKGSDHVRLMLLSQHHWHHSWYHNIIVTIIGSTPLCQYVSNLFYLELQIIQEAKEEGNQRAG